HVRFDESKLQLSSLTRAIEALGFGVAPEQASEDQSSQATLTKALVATCAGMLSMGLSDAQLSRESSLVLVVLASAILFWAGTTFYVAAWHAARRGAADMNTLVALGATVAWGVSAFVTLFPEFAAHASLDSEIY